MKKLLLLATAALALSCMTLAQDQSSTTTTTKKSHKTATDTSATSAKSSTISGCISKDKDSSGNYTIANGRYKDGVDVTGNDDLSKHAGHKVQLTGTWTTPKKSFQETTIKHVADTCAVAGAKTDTAATTSKGKKAKSTDTGTNPKS